MGPFRLDVFDAAFAWKAPVGDVKKLEGTIRANAISEMTVTVPGNHLRADLLAAPGARLRTRFRGETLITGPLRQRSGAGPGVAGDLVFSCQSDFRVLHNFLGYPNPAGTLAQQGADGAYYGIGRAPAETVLKDAVQRNIVTRRGYPLSIGPDLGRGAVIETTFRMHPLYDRLFPAVATAGIIATVEMVPGGLHLDCHTPAAYPNTLTEQSRVIQKWDFTGTGPDATSGVIGAQGQGTAREFIGFRDAARETLWGDVIEVFKDARDTSDAVTHAQRAQAALDETGPRGSLTVTLAESGNFRIFGPKGLHPGALVTARVGRGIEVTDTVSEIKFSWDRDNGLRLSATIGPQDDPTDALMQAITALAQGITDLKAGT